MPQNVVVPPFDEAPETVVGGTPQSAFEFEFPFWDTTDILVYVDGVLLDSSSYTVVGAALQEGEVVEGGYGSGTVTLDTAVSNVTVTIDRFVTGDRETQFARSAPLAMPALNGDLNRIVARQQDLKRRFDATDSGSAGVSAAAAEAAADRAETAATSSGADAVSTAEDAADADAARIAAQAAQAEVETLLAGAPPTDERYLTDAAGRAAVLDGEQYWLVTSDGLRLKTRVDASTSADYTISSLPVILMSINGMYLRREFIRFEVTALGSNNDYTVRPFDRNTRLGQVSGGGTEPYWAWEIPKANTVGSGGVTVTVLDGNGAGFITAAIRKDGNTSGLEPGDHALGDLFIGRRMTSSEDVGQRIRWVQPTDSATKRVLPAALTMDEMGIVPSTSRPLNYLKVTANHHFIQMAIDADRYTTGDHDPSDVIRVVEMDMATFQSDSGNCLSLNSTFTRVSGMTAHDLNMMFFDLVGGITVDTGRVPTTIGEPPVIGGKYEDGPSLATIAGPGHGYLVEPASTLDLTLNDATTAGVDSESEISITATIGTRKYGDKIVKTLTAQCENAAHDIYCVATWVITYDPAATQQILVQTTWDFTHADVTVTPGFLRGFAMLWAFTGMNRCQAIVNGEPQPIQTIDLRDDSNIEIGFPEEVVFWRDGRDTRQVVVTNNFGYGYTHKENGVLVAVEEGQSESYVDNFEWGVKLYAALFGDHTATTMRDMTGIVVTMEVGIEFRIAPARTDP